MNVNEKKKFGKCRPKDDKCLTNLCVIPSLSRGVLNVSPFILHDGILYSALLYRKAPENVY